MTAYDRIGRDYRSTRRPDPRIAAQVGAALAGMAGVVNVGAGTGSYEPAETVAAVEPSSVMIAQRPAGAAPCVRGTAEALPLADGAVDAALAVLTVHHWTDVDAGIAELRRVSRRRVVILTWDQAALGEFWLVREYLPAAAAVSAGHAVPVARLVELLPGARVEPVVVPHDCTDGFGAAFWRRPAAYLDPGVRAGISMLAQADPRDLADGLAALAADLDSGAWHERHRDLSALDRLDAGYRLIVSG
ncbi:class I SAM-dependent methyltransferase [Pseudonocardia humida]|uniref:Class I SAM-dependent methyltransferase n=1 Tax=Pseudonocardia humida TaxID=2800819 RepID=A0ABT0ZWW6_9PSEU|nr:methyltransferase domain-containing protein [Pseudonocardia humida]MCO1655175.1 class I SAM-dependent methyltransferase [Pseudonocardia humida]